jgi:3'-phosphoadenosine 5'-phosphosulfate sulfotransferase (PAPS reductase)/FAD synthetase
MNPDLTNYDWILVNSSAGKDSQCMLDLIVELADAAGVRDRIVVVHADLGRVEWEGVRELAEEQAKHYDLRFEAVKREQGDLLQAIEERGMWPSSTTRYCTSDHKRDQVKKVMTMLVREKWDNEKRRPIRILNCMGLRRQESPARNKRPAFVANSYANGRREVDEWLPIHEWTVDQVWARIKASGVRSHWAYERGMPRLSCCFCVFSPKPALMLAATLNRRLFTEYLALEKRMGHTFRHGLSLQMIDDALRAGETTGPITDQWNM